MPGLPKKYAKMGFKKGWAAFKKSKRGGKKAKPRAKGKGKGGRVTRAVKGAAKRVASRIYARPMTALDNGIKILVAVAPFADAITQNSGNIPELKNVLKRRYLGLEPTMAPGDPNRWDWHRASGVQAILNTLLYHKEMQFANKQIPVPRMIPKTFGEAKNLGFALVTRYGALESLYQASKAPAGQKWQNLHDSFAQSYTGMPLLPGQWDIGEFDYKLMEGQAAVVGGIVGKKVVGSLTKGMRGNFKLPRV